MKYDPKQNILYYEDKNGQHWRLDQYRREDTREKLMAMLNDACQIYVFQVAKTHITTKQQENFAEVGTLTDPRRFSAISNSATHFNGLRMKAFGDLDGYDLKSNHLASDEIEWDSSKLTPDAQRKIKGQLS